jgi:hypothetical protein
VDTVMVLNLSLLAVENISFDVVFYGSDLIRKQDILDKLSKIEVRQV